MMEPISANDKVTITSDGELVIVGQDGKRKVAFVNNDVKDIIGEPVTTHPSNEKAQNRRVTMSRDEYQNILK